MKNIFRSILLIARPAAGKSEIIAYLKSVPLEERIRRFHIGQMDEIDDFPMLWTWFEEDALLKKMGYPPIHTDEDGYFKKPYFWDLLIERIGLEYNKRMRDVPHYEDAYTTVIEFSRGSEHGGYRSAFAHLSQTIIQQMAVLYIDVSWEDSLRKNRRRFNPEKPDSILEHGLPDEKLERLYKETDWQEVCKTDKKYLPVQGLQVPYIIFDNHDDVTSQPGEGLANRLEEKLNDLWEYKLSRSNSY
ncbi:MAG: hypothetical protein CVU42_06795 [Chloroflexi bacterium HGW-Chloroflexi-4]|jgi:hypothetical protein|nr:MAG: hypothetical protein CVU42_06795 [Chloroflexi bacterium HGW-Chloroflexi-4]